MTFKLHPESPEKHLWSKVESLLFEFEPEVRTALPELHDPLEVYLSNRHLIDGEGSGGFAYSPTIMTLSFDPDFADKEKQKQNFRSTLFHEGFHLVQGHTAVDTRAVYKTALDSAIYEGAATVFEKSISGNMPPWGQYGEHSHDLLESWQQALRDVSFDEYYNGEGVYEKLAFFDPEDQQRWKLYKVGAWLVEKYLAAHPEVDILDTRHYSASDYLS